MDNILYQIFKKYKTAADSCTIIIYINQTENRITFRKNTGCHLELLKTQTMKLLGSTQKDN